MSAWIKAGTGAVALTLALTLGVPAAVHTWGEGEPARDRTAALEPLAHDSARASAEHDRVAAAYPPVDLPTTLTMLTQTASDAGLRLDAHTATRMGSEALDHVVWELELTATAGNGPDAAAAFVSALDVAAPHLVMEGLHVTGNVVTVTARTVHAQPQ